MRGGRPDTTSDLIGESQHTIESAAPGRQSEASSPDVGADRARSLSLKGQSEWLQVAQMQPKSGGALGRQSLTSSVKSLDKVSDQNVKGGLTK